MDEEVRRFKEEMERMRDRAGSALSPGSVKPIFLSGKTAAKETIYTIEEVVSPTRDVIVPFYLSSLVKDITYVKMNIYFPGLQPGDYPFNTDTLYISPVSKGVIEYGNGSFSRLRSEYSLFSGNGAAGGNYYWYRGYTRFQVAPIHGFKLTSCNLYWTLGDRNSVGAGGNTQRPNILHAIDDYDILDKNDWSLATQVNYGNVNIYTDTIGNAYNKDVKTRVQSLVNNLTDYSCFRFLSSEHADTSNANNYWLNEPQLKCVLEEDTDGEVGVYMDNGDGFGSMVDYYKVNAEDTELTRFISGSGKKQLKLSCSKTRRVNILLRIGFRSG